MRVGETGKRATHRFEWGGVDADAGAAGRGFEIEHIETMARAGGDGRHSPGIAAACAACLRDIIAYAAVEKLQAALDRVGRAFRFDGAGIGGVDEGQLARRVARPHRRLQCFDDHPQRRGLGRELFMACHQIDEFALDAAGIFEAKHGAAADGAALRFDRLAGKCRERHRECFAAQAQPVDGMFHCGGFGRIEPAAESEHAMRGRYAECSSIAIDARFVGAGRPIHHDLRLGKQQRVGAIGFIAQPRDLIARPGFQTRRARPAPHQHDRGDDGKQHDAENERHEG